MMGLRRWILSIGIGAVFLPSLAAVAADECEDRVLAHRQGAAFLLERNPSFHQATSIFQPSRDTAPANASLSDRVVNWLMRVDRLLQRAETSEGLRQQIQAHFLGRYVLARDQIPDDHSHYRRQAAHERERGVNQTLSAETRERIAHTLIQDQSRSLLVWLDYFLSSESRMYPTWAKVWAFSSLVRLGHYDPDTGVFARRGRDQVGPFPELNREALTLVMDQALAHARGMAQQTNSNLNFGRLYGQALRRVTNPTEIASSEEGTWVRFSRNSDPTALVGTLAGMNTGWCTAGLATAIDHLAGGDFYVYFSNDEYGLARLPRIAIRMERNQIMEIRGVAKDQNLDPRIAVSGILEAKLREFGDEGARFLMRSEHMRRLTQIEDALQQSPDLSIADLRFLYEIDGPIQGFGHQRDPRVEELQHTRDQRQDLARIFNLRPEEIALSREEWTRPGIQVHYGNVFLEANSGTVHFPPLMIGDISLGFRADGSGLTLPRTLIGHLNAYSLSSGEHLVLPAERIDGDIIYGAAAIGSLPRPRIFHGRFRHLSVNALDEFFQPSPQLLDTLLETLRLRNEPGSEAP